MRYEFNEFYIPERMMRGLQLYVEQGILPGSFLQAVLRNDFKEVCGQADEENMRNLPAYAAWLYNVAPAACQGSMEKVDAWCEHKWRKSQELITDTETACGFCSGAGCELCHGSGKAQTFGLAP